MCEGGIPCILHLHVGGNFHEHSMWLTHYSELPISERKERLLDIVCTLLIRQNAHVHTHKKELIIYNPKMV